MFKMTSSKFSLLAEVRVCGAAVYAELTDSIAPKGKQTPGYQEHLVTFLISWTIICNIDPFANFLM